MTGIGAAVAAWHIKAFGEDCTPLRVAKKTLEESAELFGAAKSLNWDATVCELADVAITCHALAYRLGVSLDSITEARLREVAKRTDQIDRDRQRGIDP